MVADRNTSTKCSVCYTQVDQSDACARHVIWQSWHTDDHLLAYAEDAKVLQGYMVFCRC